MLGGDRDRLGAAMSRRRWWMWLMAPHLCIHKVWLHWRVRRAIGHNRQRLRGAEALDIARHDYAQHMSRHAGPPIYPIDEDAT